jgi:Tfp pilus assembly protein PilF
VRNADQKEDIYKKAISKFNSERAKFNLAALYLNQGKDAKAEACLNELKASDPDVLNAKGVIALHKEDYKTAEQIFRKAGTDDAKANLGVVLILTGQYDEAAQVLKDPKGCCNNSVLAYILTDQLEKAAATAHCKDPRVQYLKAIICARQGDADGVKSNLEKAFKNPALKERAAKDIEFAAYTL